MLMVDLLDINVNVNVNVNVDIDIDGDIERYLRPNALFVHSV
jgi:hypothetical protein